MYKNEVVIIQPTIIAAIIGFFGLIIIYILNFFKPDIIKQKDYLAGELTCKKYVENVQKHLSIVHVLEMASEKHINKIYVPLNLIEEIEKYKTRIVGDTARSNKELEAMIDLSYTNEYPPEDVLENYQRILILAEPGAGKTTIAKKLALQVAEEYLDNNYLKIPIFIDIAQYAGYNYNLHKYLESIYSWENCWIYLERKLKEGSCVIFLDGLDEVGQKVAIKSTNSNTEYTTFHINNFVSKYPNCKYIVFSRRSFGVLEGFKHFNLKRFSSEDIDSFIQKWFDDEPAIGRDFRARIYNNPVSFSFARNPLLLVSLAVVFERDYEVPSRISEVLKRCLEILLSKWDHTRGIKREFKLITEEKKLLLKELAFWMHEQEIRFIDKKDLINKIENILPDFGKPSNIAEDVFEEICQHNGILTDLSTKYCCFSHLSFQEFFTAEYCNDHYNEKYLLEKIINPWWYNVIAVYASMCNSSDLLNNILSIEDNYFNQILFIAGICLVESYKVNRSLRNKIINEIVNVTIKTKPFIEPRSNRGRVILSKLLNSELVTELEKLAKDSSLYRKQRLLALRIIAEGLPSNESSEIVVRVFKSSNKTLRCEMAEILGHIGTTECAKELLTGFLELSDDYSWDCGAALQHVHVQEFDPQIERIFNKGIDLIAKIRAAQFSYKFPCNTNKALMKKIYQNKNEDIILRVIALSSFLRMYDEPNKTIIAKQIKTNKFPWQLKAIVAIETKRINDLNEYIEEAKDVLQLSSKPMDKWFSSLIFIKLKSQLVLIKSILFDEDEDINLKVNILMALESWVSDEVYELLAEISLSSKLEEDIRIEAIEVLQRLGVTKVLPKLKLLVEKDKVLPITKTKNIKRAAFRAIGYIGRDQELTYLLEHLEKEHEPISRSGLIEALYIASNGFIASKSLNNIASTSLLRVKI